MRSDVLDELARLAREASEAPIDEAQRDAQIARAMRESSASPLPLRPAVPRGSYLLAAAALVLLGMWAFSDGSSPETRHGAGEFLLASGDRVTTGEGALLSLESTTTHERRIELRAGSALFDVVPLVADASFMVVAGDLEVWVRGTVFTVAHDAGRTSVRVYEGCVDVRRGATLVARLAAGESYSSSSPEAHVEDELGDPARAAAAARAHVPPPVPARAGERSTERAASTRVAESSAPPSESSSAEVAPETVAAVDPTPAPTRSAPRSAPHVEDSTQAEPALVSPSEIAAMLAARRFEEARLAALEGARSASEPWRYRLLEAQALQGLGRSSEAAAAYDDIARRGPTAGRAESAYRAATLRWRSLHDARGALAALALADFRGSALQERALGLRARALEESGDHAAALEAARRYLETYPEGSLAPEMRAIAPAP